MRSFIFATLSGLPLAYAATASSVPVGVSIRSCTQPDVIALTFDDGPFAHTDSLLDQLTSAGLKATFFVNGNNWANINDYSATVSRMVEEGHQVASHTYNHPDMVTISDATIRTEMTRLEDDLINIIGRYSTYMRPPYFSYNNETLRVLAELGYHVIDADIDTNDWQHNTPETFQTAVNLFQQGIDNGGSIALMHDVHQNTVQNVVPAVIDIVLQSGKRSVTVGECLGDPEANWYRTSRS
ncbi:hypothetical protein F66182_2187 [Fusarium sp. NRRL 66182]|nr:hypothetical protein F66182_2187 [Fusarium sp. NRRL 66182]